MYGPVPPYANAHSFSPKPAPPPTHPPLPARMAPFRFPTTNSPDRTFCPTGFRKVKICSPVAGCMHGCVPGPRDVEVKRSR